MTKVLITGSVYPDIDAVSCAFAYTEYLRLKDTSKEYSAMFGGGVHVEPRFVCDQLGLRAPIIKSNSVFDEFILVDASEAKGLPSVVRHADVIEVVDHRLFAEYEAFPQAKFRVEPVGAAATQIAEFFYFDNDVQLDPLFAALLLCGIYSNTVNFLADTTTFRDKRMREWLESRMLPEHKTLPTRMYEFKSVYAFENLEEVLRDDAKDNCDFGLDEPVVVFQIETSQAQKLLTRQHEIIELMQQLFPESNYQLLLLQDAQKGQTLAITSSTEVKNVLHKTSIKFENTSLLHRLIIPKITMRKSIQHAVNTAK